MNYIGSKLQVSMHEGKGNSCVDVLPLDIYYNIDGAFHPRHLYDHPLHMAALQGGQ